MGPANSNHAPRRERGFHLSLFPEKIKSGTTIHAMKFPFLAILLFSTTISAQPFSLGKDDNGDVIDAFVHNDKVSADQLAEIAKIPTLKHLVLGMAPEGVRLEKGALSVLGNCRELESLRLAKYDLTDTDLHFLSKLESLQILYIEGSDHLMDSNNRIHGLTDACLASLAGLKNLDRLNIRGHAEFSDDFAKNISTLPKLTALELSSIQFTDEALKAIAANPRLKELSIQSPHFTDAGVEALAQMPALEELELGSSSLTQKSLHALAPLTGLKVLDLPIKEIDPDAFAIVAGMRSMKRLILRRAEIGDAHFELLKDHPSLESLFFENSTLTVQSKEVLETMGALEFAQFGNNSWIRIFNKE
jgi:internalin A